jgi:hypothetical protein
MPSIHVHYDANGRTETPKRRIVRIVVIVIAIIVVLWLVGYTLFNVGGTSPGTGTGDVLTTP